MADKKRVNEAEEMALSPLDLVMGDVPVSYPDGRRKAYQERQKLDPEMEGTVKRLIAHLKDEK
ncbi:MAG: hypothetical protein NTV38_13645 [Chloroflexi bacterium]|nr:hypothetical protein [Chloroflexota bacterium]